MWLTDVLLIVFLGNSEAFVVSKTYDTSGFGYYNKMCYFDEFIVGLGRLPGASQKKKFGNQLLLKVHVDRMSEGSVKLV